MAEVTGYQSSQKRNVVFELKISDFWYTGQTNLANSILLITFKVLLRGNVVSDKYFQMQMMYFLCSFTIGIDKALGQWTLFYVLKEVIWPSKFYSFILMESIMFRMQAAASFYWVLTWCQEI